MREIIRCCLVCALIAFAFSLVAKAQAVGRPCEEFPRTVGLFGAMDQPKPAATVADAIRSQLPGVATVRGMQETRLGPSGETVVMYDTQDSSEPIPKVAVLVGGKLAKLYDLSSLVEYGQGGIYAASCEFELMHGQNGLAIAYVLSGDGTGSAFLVLTWFEGDYQLIFHRTVGQGRMVFGTGVMKLWDRAMGKYASRPDSPKFECEWCPHRYLITEFRWRGDEYLKVRSALTSRAYDPAQISGIPLLIEPPNGLTEKPGP